MRMSKADKQALEKVKERAKDGMFLHDWLQQSEDARREFEADTASNEENEKWAQSLGYPSLRKAQEHWERAHLVLERFLSDSSFQKLWKILQKEDARYGGFAFSSANGGFPFRIMRAIEDWYKVPKFTSAERRKHQKKIETTCEDLLLLLEQVAYSTETDVDFSGFYRLSPNLVSDLFDLFQSPKKWRKEFQGGRYRAYSALTRSGITPVWAVKYIQESAARTWDHVELPTKIRAKGAMKTFMIRRLWRDLRLTFLLEPTSKEEQISYEHFAEIVGLVCDADCNADDVRKALRLN